MRVTTVGQRTCASDRRRLPMGPCCAVAMRCVQWLAKRQRERIDIFATATIHHLKPSSEAAN